jgi:hypothetical protein
MQTKMTLVYVLVIMGIMVATGTARSFREMSEESDSQEAREDVLAKLFERAFRKRAIHSFPTKLH